MQVNVSFKLNNIMAAKKKSKLSKKDFTNSEYALEMVDLGQAHIRYITFLFFKKKINDLEFKC